MHVYQKTQRKFINYANKACQRRGEFMRDNAYNLFIPLYAQKRVELLNVVNSFQPRTAAVHDCSPYIIVCIACRTRMVKRERALRIVQRKSNRIFGRPCSLVSRANSIIWAALANVRFNQRYKIRESSRSRNDLFDDVKDVREKVATQYAKTLIFSERARVSTQCERRHAREKRGARCAYLAFSDFVTRRLLAQKEVREPRGLSQWGFPSDYRPVWLISAPGNWDNCGLMRTCGRISEESISRARHSAGKVRAANLSAGMWKKQKSDQQTRRLKVDVTKATK